MSHAGVKAVADVSASASVSASISASASASASEYVTDLLWTSSGLAPDLLSEKGRKGQKKAR